MTDPVPDRGPADRAPYDRDPFDRPVLPEQTGDDLDVGWGEPPGRDRDDDERFLRERPPHWQ